MTCIELGNHSVKQALTAKNWQSQIYLLFANLTFIEKSFGFKVTVEQRNSHDKNLAKPDYSSCSISVGLGRPL